ncbi:MAG: Helix-turn-helix domain [Sporomusa sp.]|jgi:transcriptional regulator with XRE-family HTH domain|nr:Helix-turn-helix domain [Sporomusa sp.]
MNFGDKIRYVREKFSLTTEQLAKLLKVTQSYISHVENNRRQLGRDKIVVLAKELQVPVEFFLREDVKTLEELELTDKLRSMLNNEKYLNYFVVMDKAVEADISPEELEQAIEFIKKYKRTQGQ